MSVWEPQQASSTRVDAFRRFVNRKHGLQLKTYQQLHKWSVSDIQDFATDIWIFCGIKYSAPPTQAGIGLDKMYPRPRWFPDALLNYTENVLSTGLSSQPDAVAVSACEDGGVNWRHLTWWQLRDEVEIWTSALRRAGLKAGDRVAAVMTNSIECLLLLLAAGAIGAIFSSTSPEMGVAGLVERYLQISPKILFLDTSVKYGGKSLNLQKKLAEAAEKLHQLVPGLDKIVVVKGSAFQGAKVQSVQSFLAGETIPLEYEQLPFDHPIYILYSSGTTGPPKCICHAAGGSLLQQKKELMLCSDVGLSSTFYQYTTTGWMMWVYMVGALSCGSRIILYDGSPTYPSPSRQLEILEQQGVTHWGTSPKFLRTIKQENLHDCTHFEDLRYVLSAGSPLTADIYPWFYNFFPKRVGLFNGSGGTDVVSGIIMCSPITPVYAGEISTASLGLKVEIWDTFGKDVASTGEKGDLVITKPFFSMPTTFWGKDGETKYRKAYFEAFPGVWSHGDFIRQIPATGGYEVLGRSDGVLNPGGVRIGTAELYAVIDKFTEIEDCIIVGQRRKSDSDERIAMFVKMRTGRLTDELRRSVRAAVRQSLTARHVPALIAQVADIPYTVNGKKIENVVRDIVSGKIPTVSGTVANPKSLAEYPKFAQEDSSLRRAKI